MHGAEHMWVVSLRAKSDVGVISRKQAEPRTGATRLVLGASKTNRVARSVVTLRSVPAGIRPDALRLRTDSHRSALVSTSFAGCLTIADRVSPAFSRFPVRTPP